MNDNCILVLTSRSIEQMQDQGGSKAWVLDPRRARSCGYLVCAWNPTGDYAENTTDREHREAYLIAPISSVEPAPDEPGRYLIRFRDFARISIKGVWPHRQRNPVTYTTLSKLGINVDEVRFEVAQSPPSASKVPAAEPASVTRPLTIAAAKLGLAAHYGVEPGAIEIVIRG
jgi:hypothetical protein